MGNAGAKSQPMKDPTPAEGHEGKNTQEKKQIMTNVEPMKISPHQSPKSSPRMNTKPPTEPIPTRDPSAMVTREKNEPVVAPVMPCDQSPIETVQSVVPNKNSQHLDEQVDSIMELNPRDSVEVYSTPEHEESSVEQFHDSNLYQDRGSDLTLEETDHYEDHDEHERNNSSQQKQPVEDGQDEIELQAAFEYIREICSPTVSYSLQSDQWAHRKEGMELIQKYIERNVGPIKKMTEEQCNLEFKWICILIRKYFLDRVAPVYYSAYDCFRALLKVYSSYIHGSEIESILGSMVQPLLLNLGGESTGTNKRTQKEACRCILRIARLTAIDGLALILNMLKGDSNPSPSTITISTPTTGTSSPFPTSSSPPSSSPIGIKQKLILLKILINEFSISESSNGNYDSGISTDLVLTICQVGINHSDDKIRKSAVDILCLTYQKVGKNIKMYITDIKPAMLKVLEKKFIEIDNGALSSSSSFSSTAPAALMGSSSSSGLHDSSDLVSKTKSKKTENIRNLAPVVLKHTGGSGSFGGSKNKLLSANLNSSFSGTAMLSKNADGEENFVVMKSPSKKNIQSREQNNLSTSGSAPSFSSSSSRMDPVSRSSQCGENDKENDSHRNPRGDAVRAAVGGMETTPATHKKNRFEISEDIVGAGGLSSSPLGKKSSNGSKANPLKPQQQRNVEDNRFYIDESQF